MDDIRLEIAATAIREYICNHRDEPGIPQTVEYRLAVKTMTYILGTWTAWIITDDLEDNAIYEVTRTMDNRIHVRRYMAGDSYLCTSL